MMGTCSWSIPSNRTCIWGRDLPAPILAVKGSSHNKWIGSSIGIREAEILPRFPGSPVLMGRFWLGTKSTPCFWPTHWPSTNNRTSARRAPGTVFEVGSHRGHRHIATARRTSPAARWGVAVRREALAVRWRCGCGKMGKWWESDGLYSLKYHAIYVCIYIYNSPELRPFGDDFPY